MASTPSAIQSGPGGYDAGTWNAAYNNNSDLTGVGQSATNLASQVQNEQAPQATAATLGPAPTVQAANAGYATLAPTAVANAPGVSQTGAQQQQNLMGTLASEAAGNGPSLADQQLRTGLAQNNAQNLGMAETLGGRNNAGAMRQAIQQNNQAGQNVAAQAATQKVNEQINAQNQLASVAGTVQGQNLGEAQYGLGANEFNAGQANNMAVTQAGYQQQAGLQTSAQQQAANLANQQAAITYGTTGAGYQQAVNLANQQAKANQQQLAAQTGLSAEQIAYNATQAGHQNMIAGQAQSATDNATMFNEQNMSTQNTNQMIGSGLSAGAQGLGMATMLSDRRAKNIKGDAPDQVTEFLESLGHPHEYTYKDPNVGGSGKFVGPTAQEVASTKVGKNLVEDTPEGKAIAVPHTLGTALAAMGQLHKRLKELENKKERGA
jgi:hypothetical protein